MKRMAAVLSVLAATAFAPSAEAQDLEVGGGTEDMGGSGDRTLRLYGGLRLGFGGELEIDPERGPSADDDLLSTIGGQAGVEYVLMDYVSLGGELRLAGINTDSRDDLDIGSDLFIDAVFKPKGRFALNDQLELYGTLPIGLTFISASDDLGDDYSAGPGFNLGIGAGASYFFTDSLGINAEAAYLLYWYGAENETLAGDIEADNSLGQFTLFANAVFAL